MKKTAIFSAVSLIFCLFSGNSIFAQSTQPNAATTTTTSAPAAKKDKNQKENPDATLNGGAVNRTAQDAPVKKKKSKKVNPADIKPVDMEARAAKNQESAPAKPTPKPDLHRSKPVAGTKIEGEPMKKPENLKPKN